MKPGKPGCVEAMADYLKATGEDKPDVTVEVWLDGKKVKEVKIDVGAYVEFRDDRMCAEILGKFSAQPARGEATYAPELKGNSDEIKLSVTD